MPETAFERLTVHHHIERAITREPPPDLSLAAKAIASDGHVYEPLQVLAPGELPNAPIALAATPTITEDELRDQLREAVAAKSFAEANVRRAAETHQRSERHLVECTNRCRSFDTLDAEIAATTIAMLADEHCSRVELPDELRFRQSARSLAQDDARAAAQAERTLATALEEARREAAYVAHNARVAVTRLTHLKAEAMAVEALELEARAAMLREAVLAADSVDAKPGPAMRHIAGTGERYLRQIDRSMWQKARTALLEDPEAEIVIALPEVPAPILEPPGRLSGVIVQAVPLPELVDEEVEG